MRKHYESGIYCIENTLNHKKYIGQSVDIQGRWLKHTSELKRGCHFNDYLQKAWNKYGEESFKFYILELCEKDQLDDREKYYIDLYNTMNRNEGYNLRTGGQEGSSASNETREKLRQSIKNSYQDPNRRKIQSINALNQWANPEIKEKITGKNNGMYGKTHTEEAKRKISESKKGKPSPHRNTTPVYCVELNQIFDDAATAAKKFSCQSGTLLDVCRGKRKTCCGYHWEFLLENNIC